MKELPDKLDTEILLRQLLAKYVCMATGMTLDRSRSASEPVLGSGATRVDFIHDHPSVIESKIGECVMKTRSHATKTRIRGNSQ